MDHIGLVGLGVAVASIVVYLATLGLKRTKPTWWFDLGVLTGAALAAVGLLVSPAWWPAAVAAGLALVWFGATRKELTLPAGALRVAVGHRLPDATLLDQRGAAVTTASLAGTPTLVTFYRGAWCPYCVTQLRELAGALDALRGAGLALVAVSTDRPDEQAALAARLGDRVRFLSDEPGALLDALGVRHVDGVPFYDRLLLGARRHDIALPASVLVGADGTIRWLRRARRIDERPPIAEILAAART